MGNIAETNVIRTNGGRASIDDMGQYAGCESIDSDLTQ